MGIPVVDLDQFVNGSPQSKQAFINQLGEAFETVGFVAVKKYWIPGGINYRQYQELRKIFSLPLGEKIGF